MPVATLAGVPLEAHETVSWRFTQGVAPYQRFFEVHKDSAAAIMSAAAPGTEVELYFSAPGHDELRVKGLTVLSIAPSAHPDRLSVLVADRRIFWDRKQVHYRFNMRRRSGDFRLVDGVMERINAVPDVTFARYSLRSEQFVWTAKEVILKIVNEVTNGLYDASKVDFATALDIDGLELQDDGASAIKKVMDYVPALTGFMDADGVYVLTSTAGGDEGPHLADSGPPIVGPMLTTDVDMQRSRPSEIEVYFQPEDEMRFDGLEGYAATVNGPREPRILRNVLPLPDRKLTIAGKVVVQNTWVEINQALLDAWNNDTSNPARVQIGGRTVNLPAISFTVIQRLWLSPGGYHAYYEIAGGNSVWARRWNAIMRHYRQTYQIDRRWRDRLRSARAERVAIQDPENARRAPADIFADHCVIPSRKRIAFFRADPSKKLATNRKAWENLDDPNRLIVDARLAETAILTPLDADQFVFHATYQTDQQGNTLAIVPSILQAKADGASIDIPEADPRAAQALFLLHLAKLSPKHRFTTILTVASASPNGLGSLYKIKVSPNEAKGFLPKPVAARIGQCRGPVFQLFVSPQVATARFAWQDASAKEIEDAILDGKPRSPARLLDPVHVGNVAKSMAAIIYALFADRVEGTRVTDFDSRRLPVGRISSVVHEIGRRGAALTRLELPPHMATYDFMSLLPEGTRRQLFAKVQP